MRMNADQAAHGTIVDAIGAPEPSDYHGYCAGVLGLLLIWLLICVKRGYGRPAAVPNHAMVMDADTDLPRSYVGPYADSKDAAEVTEKAAL